MPRLTSRLLPLVTRWPWLLAFTPAWVVLAMLVPLLSPVPFQDSWVFVRQYNDFCEGRYSWVEFFHPHNAHPSAVGKAIYFAVLHWAGGDVALLPLFTWTFSMVIALGILRLSRPLWQGNRWRGAGLMFLVNLAVFSAAAGHAWIWDFVFQNVLPGMFLVLGLVVLQARWSLPIRIILALLAALLATFSFGSGFFAGLLLIPSVWHAAGGVKLKPRVILISGWTLAVLGAAWLALSCLSSPGAAPEAAGARLSHLWANLGMTGQYLLLLLGLPLGQGTVMEPGTLCALWGAALLGVAGAGVWKLARERRASRWWEAQPWLTLIAWGALNAVLICYGRMANSLNTAVAPRYVTFVLFFLVGVGLFAAVAWRTDDGVSPPVMAWWRALLPALVALLVGAHVTAWVTGHHHMLNESVRMRQEKAAFSVAPVIAPLDDQIWWYLENGDSLRWAQSLHSRDRLRKVTFATNAEVSSFRVSRTTLPDRWASWSLLQSQGGAGWLAKGTCGLSKDIISMPDLILLSAQPEGGVEKFFACAKALLPENFLEREILRRIHPGHYFGWERKIRPEELPPGARITLRAYAFDADARRVRPLEGTSVITPPAP